MKNYEILPHTSELRLKVQANSLPDLFRYALEGMNSVLKNSYLNNIVENNTRETIEINSQDSSALLIDFLSEILTLSHSRKAIFNKVKFIIFNDKYLSMEISGNESDGFDEDIKAVTYTETNIIKNKGGLFEAIIVFDI